MVNVKNVRKRQTRVSTSKKTSASRAKAAATKRARGDDEQSGPRKKPKKRDLYDIIATLSAEEEESSEIEVAQPKSRTRKHQVPTTKSATRKTPVPRTLASSSPEPPKTGRPPKGAKLHATGGGLRSTSPASSHSSRDHEAAETLAAFANMSRTKPVTNFEPASDPDTIGIALGSTMHTRSAEAGLSDLIALDTQYQPILQSSLAAPMQQAADDSLPRGLTPRATRRTASPQVTRNARNLSPPRAPVANMGNRDVITKTQEAVPEIEPAPQTPRPERPVDRARQSSQARTNQTANGTPSRQVDGTDILARNGASTGEDPDPGEENDEVAETDVATSRRSSIAQPTEEFTPTSRRRIKAAPKIEEELDHLTLSPTDPDDLLGFGGHWNRILDYRKQLLKSLLYTLRQKRKNNVFTIRVRARAMLQALETQIGDSYETPSSIRKELKELKAQKNANVVFAGVLQANLYHIVIPRFIRYIDEAHKQSDGELGLPVVGLLQDLLEILDQLLNYTTNMLKQDSEEAETPNLPRTIEQILIDIQLAVHPLRMELKRKKTSLVEDDLRKLTNSRAALLQLRAESKERRQQEQEDSDTEQRRTAEEDRKKARQEYQQAEAARVARNAESRRQRLEHARKEKAIATKEWQRRVSNMLPLRDRHGDPRPPVKPSPWTDNENRALIQRLMQTEHLSTNARYTRCGNCSELEGRSTDEIMDQAFKIKPQLERLWNAQGEPIPEWLSSIR